MTTSLLTLPALPPLTRLADPPFRTDTPGTAATTRPTRAALLASASTDQVLTWLETASEADLVAFVPEFQNASRVYGDACERLAAARDIVTRRAVSLAAATRHAWTPLLDLLVQGHVHQGLLEHRARRLLQRWLATGPRADAVERLMVFQASVIQEVVKFHAPALTPRLASWLLQSPWRSNVAARPSLTTDAVQYLFHVATVRLLADGAPTPGPCPTPRDARGVLGDLLTAGHRLPLALQQRLVMHGSSTTVLAERELALEVLALDHALPPDLVARMTDPVLPGQHPRAIYLFTAHPHCEPGRVRRWLGDPVYRRFGVAVAAAGRPDALLGPLRAAILATRSGQAIEHLLDRAPRGACADLVAALVRIRPAAVVRRLETGDLRPGRDVASEDLAPLLQRNASAFRERVILALATSAPPEHAAAVELPTSPPTARVPQ